MLSCKTDMVVSSMRMCLVLDSDLVSTTGKAIASQLLQQIVVRRYRSFSAEQKAAVRESALRYMLSVSSSEEKDLTGETFAIKLLVETYKRTFAQETGFVDQLLTLARSSDTLQRRTRLLLMLLRAGTMVVTDVTARDALTAYQREDLMKAIRSDQRRLINIAVGALTDSVVSTNAS